jgi:hypothetical protein
MLQQNYKHSVPFVPIRTSNFSLDPHIRKYRFYGTVTDFNHTDQF